jgi:uncharacterized membrane protein YGL010W
MSRLSRATTSATTANQTNTHISTITTPCIALASICMRQQYKLKQIPSKNQFN